MFKKIGIISVFIFVWSIESQACLQTITIPAKDFCVGNSLIIITYDQNGCEQVSGYISVDEGKTQYFQEEIFQYDIAMGSLKEQSQAIISDVQQNKNNSNTDDVLIYLHFEIDAYIVRVLVIKNNLLADNPFDIIEYSTSALFIDDDDDDLFGNFDDNDLTCLDLTDIKFSKPIDLSYYDSILLGSYVAWAMLDAKAQQSYRDILDWFKSKYAE